MGETAWERIVEAGAIGEYAATAGLSIDEARASWRAVNERAKKIFTNHARSVCAAAFAAAEEEARRQGADADPSDTTKRGLAAAAALGAASFIRTLREP